MNARIEGATSAAGAREQPRARRLARMTFALIAMQAGACLAGETTNPYSPAYGHPYRHGVIPTRPVRALMQAWAALHPAAPATATGSLTLGYAGGSGGIGVMSGTPRVYLVVFGNQWGTAGTDANNNVTLSNDTQGEVPFLQLLFEGIGTGGERWSGIMTQYCDGALVAQNATSCPPGAPLIGYPDGGGAFAGIWYDDSQASPAAATQDQLAQEAMNAAAYFGNTTPESNRYVQYVILSPSGTNPDNFNTTGNFCAWHSETGDYATAPGLISYTNLPYVSDSAACTESVAGSPWSAALDTDAISATHEYAESLTDFPAGSGWINPTSGTEGEAADECSNGTPDALLVATATGSFAMQLIWSNDTNACEIAHPVLGPDTIFASMFE